MTQIATAATEEVNNSVERIAKVAQDTAEGADETAKACQELSRMAVELRELLGEFKLEEGRSRGARHLSLAEPKAEAERSPARTEGELEMGGVGRA